MKQVEEVLAGRESSLQELNSCLERTNKERETEQQEYLRRIQDLELSLKKEKDGSRDLRKQVKKMVCVCVCVRACVHVICRLLVRILDWSVGDCYCLLCNQQPV
jgi:hypothetical protein